TGGGVGDLAGGRVHGGGAVRRRTHDGDGRGHEGGAAGAVVVFEHDDDDGVVAVGVGEVVVADGPGAAGHVPAFQALQGEPAVEAVGPAQRAGRRLSHGIRLARTHGAPREVSTQLQDSAPEQTGRDTVVDHRNNGCEARGRENDDFVIRAISV